MSNPDGDTKYTASNSYILRDIYLTFSYASESNSVSV